MIFDPWTIDSSARLMEQWLSNPKADDPFMAGAQMLRAYAAHHREFGHVGEAKAFEMGAHVIESIVEAVRMAEVDYDTAGSISTLERGTLKNKKSAGELGTAERGKIKLGSIPLAPQGLPGVHALRAIDNITDARKSAKKQAPSGASAEDAADAWAAQALEGLGEAA